MGYRGEVTFKFKPINAFEPCYSSHSVTALKVCAGQRMYDVGDRVGQMIIMPYPEVEFEEVKELSGSDRGTGGYGSTGR